MTIKQMVGTVLFLGWTVAGAGCELVSDFDDSEPVDTSGVRDTSASADCVAGNSCDSESTQCAGDTCAECETSADCAAGQWCDGGDCVPCSDDLHCGVACATCEGATPYCNEAGDTCVECNGANPCAAGTGAWCHVGSCEICNTAEYCGVACVTCAGATPACALDGSACVECTAHADCPGPIGACTPEQTCTCLAHDTNPKASCHGDSDCQDTDYVCAKDFSGRDGTSNADDHFACLRVCFTDGTVADGIYCEARVLVDAGLGLVWAPATSCYAYSQHVDQINCQQPLDCSAFTSYPVDDAECPSATDTCTNPCSRPGDCQEGEDCLAGICTTP